MSASPMRSTHDRTRSETSAGATSVPDQRHDPRTLLRKRPQLWAVSDRPRFAVRDKSEGYRPLGYLVRELIQGIDQLVQLQVDRAKLAVVHKRSAAAYRSAISRRSPVVSPAVRDRSRRVHAALEAAASTSTLQWHPSLPLATPYCGCRAAVSTISPGRSEAAVDACHPMGQAWWPQPSIASGCPQGISPVRWSGPVRWKGERVRRTEAGQVGAT